VAQVGGALAAVTICNPSGSAIALLALFMVCMQ
jgi:hypothetical protein